MILPCRCKGDVAAVHHDCLKRWLIEVQKRRERVVVEYRWIILLSFLWTAVEALYFLNSLSFAYQNIVSSLLLKGRSVAVLESKFYFETYVPVVIKM